MPDDTATITAAPRHVRRETQRLSFRACAVPDGSTLLTIGTDRYEHQTSIFLLPADRAALIALLRDAEG